LGLNIADLLISNDFNVTNKGNIAELFVGLELIIAVDCYEKTDLYYWHREAKNSQAEQDYVCQFGNIIVPIEVKAGTKGSMQSLYLFLTEKNLSQGFRLSLENFSEINEVKILPIYVVKNLVQNLN
jgi:predicted AAA+ superfamily ATPase